MERLFCETCREKRNNVVGATNIPNVETFSQKTWSASVALNHIPAAEADQTVSASMWTNKATAPGADLRDQIATAMMTEMDAASTKGME